MIDFILIVVVLLVGWCAASEGVWGAAFIVISVLLSGLLAMNLFEPLAGFLEGISSNPRWGYYCDIIALLGLFGLGVFALRAATDYLMPTYVQVHPLVYDVGRFGLGLVAGYLTMAILATALHTAPLPRSFAGFDPGPNHRLLFGIGPDRQWLAFTQYVSEKALARSRPRIFDGGQFRLVEADNPSVATAEPVWSSFPIRYADRREQFSAGAAIAGGGGAPPPQTGPPPTQAPAGGGTPTGF
jgi:hypothetical protein